MFGFEKLEVWQKALDLTDRIYSQTRSFPRHEAFGLTNQVRRAAVSIAANISEGSGRGTAKDFQHFISISFGSINEVVTLLHVALRQGYINRVDFEAIYDELEIIGKMLSGLSKSLEDRQ